MVSGAMGGVGDKLSRWGANNDSFAGKMARRAGGNLEASGANASALGQMVPPDKVLGGGYSGLKAAGGGGALGAAKAGLGGSIAPTHSKLPDKLSAYQSRRRFNFEDQNSLVETKDHNAFYSSKKNIDRSIKNSQHYINNARPIKSNFSTDDEYESARLDFERECDARRSSIISEITSSGGIPVEKNGRYYLETNPVAIREYVEKLI